MIICCLITLNEILTYGKIQWCTLNQSWDIHILKSDCYLYIVFSSNTCKNLNLKIALKLLCIIDYLLFNNTKWGINLWKIQLCTLNQSWDMDILKSYCYCILCSIALMQLKIKIWKTALKLLYIIDYLLFNNAKSDINLWKNSIMYT